MKSFYYSVGCGFSYIAGVPVNMGKKQAAGENSRKAAGNAKKAEVAASKAAVEKNKKDQAESEEWSKGAKSNAKA